jgi:dTDP-4-dehydrorhamnose 3,5-epimerase
MEGGDESIEELLKRAPPADIHGVRVHPLKLLPNERGRLMEVQRSDEPGFPGYAQSYITSTLPGVIKAWYRHHRQVDQMTVVTGLLKLVLYDGRDDSPTRGRLNEIIIGEVAPRLVLIPPGVWHGFQAIGRETFCLHLNTVAWKAEDTDEDRLPVDDPSIPYKW